MIIKDKSSMDDELYQIYLDLFRHKYQNSRINIYIIGLILSKLF